VTKDEEIEQLKYDLDCQEKATAFVYKGHKQATQRIAQLNEMLDEAMRIFALYLNVPESRALQERWDKLKNAP